MFNFLTRRKELEELERWRTQWQEARRWLAEFDQIGRTLDLLKALAEGKQTKPNPLADLRNVLRDEAGLPFQHDAPSEWFVLYQPEQKVYAVALGLDTKENPDEACRCSLATIYLLIERRDPSWKVVRLDVAREDYRKRMDARAAQAKPLAPYVVHELATGHWISGYDLHNKSYVTHCNFGAAMQMTLERATHFVKVFGEGYRVERATPNPDVEECFMVRNRQGRWLVDFSESDGIKRYQWTSSQDSALVMSQARLDEFARQNGAHGFDVVDMREKPAKRFAIHAEGDGWLEDYSLSNHVRVWAPHLVDAMLMTEEDADRVIDNYRGQGLEKVDVSPSIAPDAEAHDAMVESMVAMIRKLAVSHSDTRLARRAIKFLEDNGYGTMTWTKTPANQPTASFDVQAQMMKVEKAGRVIERAVVDKDDRYGCHPELHPGETIFWRLGAIPLIKDFRD